MASLLCCGPKLAACGIVLSAWGVIMLVRGADNARNLFQRPFRCANR
uniref:Ribonuclease K n=1 Tax=Panthera tigris altaica TaxID=74533 RepID=A0A8C9JCI0_PANTA